MEARILHLIEEVSHLDEKIQSLGSPLRSPKSLTRHSQRLLKRLDVETEWMREELRACKGHHFLLQKQTRRKEELVLLDSKVHGEGDRVLEDLRVEMTEEVGCTMDIRDLQKSQNDQLEAILQTFPDESPFLSPNSLTFLRDLDPLSPHIPTIDLSFSPLGSKVWRRTESEDSLSPAPARKDLRKETSVDKLSEVLNAFTVTQLRRWGGGMEAGDRSQGSEGSGAPSTRPTSFPLGPGRFSDRSDSGADRVSSASPGGPSDLSDSEGGLPHPTGEGAKKSVGSKGGKGWGIKGLFRGASRKEEGVSGESKPLRIQEEGGEPPADPPPPSRPRSSVSVAEWGGVEQRRRFTRQGILSNVAKVTRAALDGEAQQVATESSGSESERELEAGEAALLAAHSHIGGARGAAVEGEAAEEDAEAAWHAVQLQRFTRRRSTTDVSALLGRRGGAQEKEEGSAEQEPGLTRRRSLTLVRDKGAEKGSGGGRPGLDLGLVSLGKESRSRSGSLEKVSDYSTRPNELAEELLRSIAAVYERLAARTALQPQRGEDRGAESSEVDRHNSPPSPSPTARPSSTGPRSPMQDRGEYSRFYPSPFTDTSPRGADRRLVRSSTANSDADLTPPASHHKSSSYDSDDAKLSSSAPKAGIRHSGRAAGSFLGMSMRRSMELGQPVGGSAALQPSGSLEFLLNWAGDACTPTDPYGVLGFHPCANSGDYASTVGVRTPPPGDDKDRTDAMALLRYKALAEQLEKVDPGQLSHEQKLSFWINLYNALLLYTYVVSGKPQSNAKRWGLVQKASLAVGRFSVSAVEIEYAILRACSHKSPQMGAGGWGSSIAARRLLGPRRGINQTKNPSAHKFEPGDERAKWALDKPEPLVSFALCPGSLSGPSLRMYSPDNIFEELERAKTMFLMAHMGLSNHGKVLLPKILEWYSIDFVPEDSKVTEWAACELPEPQRSAVLRYLPHMSKQPIVKCVDVVPYDWSFRYLIGSAPTQQS